METLVIQIGLRQGRSSDIHKIQDREMHLGRAFSNDIILTDPYVAAQQLRIYRVGVEGEDLSWNINVLDTGNPVLLNGEAIEGATAEIIPGDIITVGRTHLRVFAEDHKVEPTRQLFISGWLDKLGRASGPILLAFLGVSLLDSVLSYFLHNINGDIEEHALDTLSAMALILAWAGAWAIVGRLLRHQPHFGLHLLTTCLVVALAMFQAPIAMLSEFFTDSESFTEVISALVGAALLAYMLRFNLHFATNIKHTSAIAVIFSVGLMGITWLYTLDERDEFDYQPSYSQALLPPAVNGSGGISTDEFFETFDQLD